MRLLIIVDSYPPQHTGGYELRCRDIVDGWIKRGHNAFATRSAICTERFNTNLMYYLHPGGMPNAIRKN